MHPGHFLRLQGLRPEPYQSVHRATQHSDGSCPCPCRWLLCSVEKRPYSPFSLFAWAGTLESAPRKGCSYCSFNFRPFVICDCSPSSAAAAPPAQKSVVMMTSPPTTGHRRRREGSCRVEGREVGVQTAKRGIRAAVLVLGLVGKLGQAQDLLESGGVVSLACSGCQCTGDADDGTSLAVFDNPSSGERVRDRSRHTYVLLCRLCAT